MQHPGPPALVLLHPLGCSGAIWDDVAAALSPARRVLRPDLPGHGARRGEACRAPSLQALAGDVLGQLARQGLNAGERFDVAGLSIGGMLALTLAHGAAARVRRLVVANGSAHLPPGAQAGWQARAQRAVQGGMAGLVGGTLARCLTPAALAAGAPLRTAIERQLLACSPQAYAGLTQALLDADLRAWLPGIAQPVLVASAADDDVWPAGSQRGLLDGLPRATHACLPGRHFAPVEFAPDFARRIEAFLDAPAASGHSRTRAHA